MKFQDFWMRVICLVVVVASLTFYQSNALEWKQEEAANAEAIAQAEAHNADVLANANDAEDDTQSGGSGFADGTYTGSAQGFGGLITVEVTVTDGAIAAIDIASAPGEDSAYLNSALQVIDRILQAQGTGVDTVSGATFSSTGIVNATADALQGALQGGAA